MSKYTSIGTLRYRISMQDGNESQAIFFIPSDDYSVKHHGKNYAIFISTHRALLRKYKPENKQGIKLNVASDTAKHLCLSALKAAKDHARVEIVVKETESGGDDAPDIEFVGITIPAE